ncbi:MAG: N-acetylmuramoyl-L-alanine amidase [Candidatus Omnitrophica bacterium]|nr:N-acetylmuramoyl-L-alanine amidase [Candidatus Omnitrophota bacterium]
MTQIKLKSPPLLFLHLSIGTVSFILLFLASCSTGSMEKYGMVEMFHEKPMMPRMVPRQYLGEMPSGHFQSQLVKGILILDSGADYQGETPMTYLTSLLNRYQTKEGLGDLPFHYFIDEDGKIFKGRQDHVPAELHEDDPYLVRSGKLSQQDLLVKRLSRKTKPQLNLNGFITIMLLGDYDQQMASKEQEKSLFQLASFLCFEYYLARESVLSLRTVVPEAGNPGFYLNNYTNPAILEANIPPTPRKPHLLKVPGQDG